MQLNDTLNRPGVVTHIRHSTSPTCGTSRLRILYDPSGTVSILARLPVGKQ
jgi:hypothetical protein